MSFHELSSACAQKFQERDARITKLEAKKAERKEQIKRLDKRIDDAWREGPGWIEEIIDPFANEMAEYLGAEKFEVSGPYGINARILIFFYFGEKGYKYLEIRPGDLLNGKLKVADQANYDVDEVRDPNQIGCPTVEIPESADFAWFQQFLVSD